MHIQSFWQLQEISTKTKTTILNKNNISFSVFHVFYYFCDGIMK